MRLSVYRQKVNNSQQQGSFVVGRLGRFHLERFVRVSMAPFKLSLDAKLLLVGQLCLHCWQLLSRHSLDLRAVWNRVAVPWPNVPLQVPISAAGMLLVGMVSRIPTRDPE